MFDAYVSFHAKFRPRGIAVAGPRETLTFAQLDARIDRAAHLLGGIGAAPGQSVSIAVDDEVLHWILVLALARRGIATAPAHDTPSAFALTDTPDGARADALILGPDEVAAISTGPHIPFAPVRPDADALGRVMRSSGTTGEEKRIGMSWAVIDAGIRNAFIAYGAPTGIWHASTGISTILGLIVGLACWASGNTLLLGTHRMQLAESLPRFRPSLVALVPDQLRRLLAAGRFGEGAAPHWPLRIVSGGGLVPRSLARRAGLALTRDLRSVYGASETGSVAVATLDLLEREAGVAGYVLPKVEVQIVDEADRPLAPGVLGHVRIRGERVVGGYMEKSERTAETFRNGWFYPGDLGRLREDGLLLVEGRADDLMNLGGHKILPAWVEEVARECAGVADAGAFDAAAPDGLRQCCLAIVRGEGFDQERVIADLRARLTQLGDFQLLILPAIPRNAMGKIERDRLRAFHPDAKRPAPESDEG